MAYSIRFVMFMFNLHGRNTKTKIWEWFWWRFQIDDDDNVCRQKLQQQQKRSNENERKNNKNKRANAVIKLFVVRKTTFQYVADVKFVEFLQTQSRGERRTCVQTHGEFLNDTFSYVYVSELAKFLWVLFLGRGGGGVETAFICTAML